MLTPRKNVRLVGHSNIAYKKLDKKNIGRNYRLTLAILSPCFLQPCSMWVCDPPTVRTTADVTK